jgi:WS/DGAT/MGAT family acyltransferase
MNQRIGRNRRFTTQQYPLDRLRAMAHAGGGTLNDVLIALCAGGLQRFLGDMNELPKQPLVAWLPVNVRPKDDEGGGNAIGAILVSMATDIKDPKKRFEAIVASTSRAKEQFKGMASTTIMEYSLLLMTPALLQIIEAMTGNLIKMPATFNVCISNVPGPEKPLYMRGARMEAVYPVSIPSHSQALNITVQSYAGYLDVGFIGCRDTLPHLQKLAVYTNEAFQELERALLGLEAPAAKAKARNPAAKSVAAAKTRAKTTAAKPAPAKAAAAVRAKRTVAAKPAANAKKPVRARKAATKR